ncbi:DNA topoisomerase 2 isoform X2, partial [Tanacetum coccineum]
FVTNISYLNNRSSKEESTQLALYHNGRTRDLNGDDSDKEEEEEEEPEDEDEGKMKMKETGVSNFSGNVSEKTRYHHGVVSLEDAMVGMAASDV